MTKRQFFRGLFLAIAGGACLWGQQYTITTIAGNGSAGFSGDSGPATQAQLSSPGAIAIDPSSGKIYIADGGNHRVRMIANGTITTVAGNGTKGFAGDKAAATSAQLNNPTGVALDAAGNLYIADAANNVVRQVSPSGTITTFAGNQTAGYTGDGGAATSAELSNPVAVVVDSGNNVYIADAGNNVIRMVSSGNISTIAGSFYTAANPLHHPDGLAVDASRNLYIADTLARQVLQFSGGAITVLAGTTAIGFGGDDGPATQSILNDPMGVAVDAAGNVYIADTFNGRIRRIGLDGAITTIAGTGYPGSFGDGGSAKSAGLYFPHAVAVDTAGNIYISDTFGNVVRMLQPAAPHITQGGVVNAASFAPQISPGALATAFGSDMAAAETRANAPLPRNLAGVSVTVNGQPAPVLSASPGQVNFQVPWETPIGDASVVVRVNGRVSNTITVPVVAAGPGIFSQTSSRALVQNADQSLNAAANPAKAGSTVVAYLTGSGPLSATLADGAAAPTDATVWSTAKCLATIGQEPAQIAFAGLAPGLVGLVQMNIEVPSDLLAGDYPLTVSINGETSNSATISVRQ